MRDPHDSATLVVRVLRHLSEGTSDCGPRGQAPVEEYTSAGHFEAERARILRTHPAAVAHSSELPRPGSFVTLDYAGIPLLVTRNAGGEAAAFLNVCRHRGTKLVWDRSGERKSFVCPYHAWTYGADGRLLGIPHGGSFSAARDGLVAVPVVERFGLVWVTPGGAAALDFDGYVGALAPDLERLGLGDLVVHAAKATRWQMNWKVVVDGALETYHFKRAHEKTIYPSFFDNLLVYDAFSGHARLVLPRRSLSKQVGADPGSISLRQHAHLIYFLFPTTLILAMPNHVALIRVAPVSAVATDVTITMLAAEAPQPERTADHWARNFEALTQTLSEDFVIGERIQETLLSGANAYLSFGSNEVAVTDFHETLRTRFASIATGS